VRGLDVVTADGEARRVDADSEPDLFWALRGGGGRCAIVTALELELQPVPEAYGGLRMWPAERAGEALELFRRLAEELPETTTIVLRYLSLPPFEAIPEPLRGRRVVALLAVHLGGEEEGRRLLAPLEEPGDALVDTFASVGAADLVRVAGDPEEPGPSRGDGLLLEDLPEDLAETLAERMAGDALAPVTVVELRRLGGALGRTPDGHGALASLPAPFSFFAAGIVPDPGVRAAIAEKLAELRSLVGPWASPRTVLNASGGGIDPATAFEPGVWERLERVRDHYDPDRLILGNHEPA
jgi:FAD/FMN-containing dehydrogenase